MFLENMLVENEIAKDREAAVSLLSKRLYESGRISDLSEFKNAVRKREAEFSCELAPGVFVPHAVSEAVLKPSVATMKTADGKRIYLIASNSAQVHIKALAELSRELLNE